MKIINAFLCIIAAAGTAFAVEGIETIPVKDNIYLLVSPQGGNVVVSTGPDGAFLIDDQLTGRSEIVEAAARELGGPAKFILNTHYHFDHTGGNEFFGGQGAVILAHDNVRRRLSTDQFIAFFKKDMPALAERGLPVITLTTDLTLHYNGDEVRLIHAANAHTDGDTFAHFREDNVIVAGDLVFNGMFPFIDAEHGGSIRGVLAAQEAIIALADDATVIVPGHGPLMNKKELIAYRSDLAAIADTIGASIKKGDPLEAVVAQHPAKAVESKFSGGPVSAEAFVRIVYEDLKDEEATR